MQSPASACQDIASRVLEKSCEPVLERQATYTTIGRQDHVSR